MTRPWWWFGRRREAAEEKESDEEERRGPLSRESATERLRRLMEENEEEDEERKEDRRRRERRTREIRYRVWNAERNPYYKMRLYTLKRDRSRDRKNASAETKRVGNVAVERLPKTLPLLKRVCEDAEDLARNVRTLSDYAEHRTKYRAADGAMRWQLPVEISPRRTWTTSVETV